MRPISHSEAVNGFLPPPNFSQDLRFFLWTDENRPQQQYTTVVAEWCFFHDLMDGPDTDKIEENLCDTFLESLLYGGAHELVKSVSAARINSET